MPSNKSPVIVRIPGCCCPSSSTTQPSLPFNHGAEPADVYIFNIPVGSFVVAKVTTGGATQNIPGYLKSINDEKAVIENPEDGSIATVETLSINHYGGNSYNYIYPVAPSAPPVTIINNGGNNNFYLYRAQTQSSNIALRAIVKTLK